MNWIKALRLPICFLAALLAVTSFRLSDVTVNWLAVIAVFFIACAAMLQNDWRDRDHDARKGKRLALDHPRPFFRLLVVVWVIVCGLVYITVFSRVAAAGDIGILLAVTAFASLVYSEIRRIPMASILLVSTTSAAPALLPVVAGVNKTETVWMLFLSVMLIIFGREIIKDLKDKKIDYGYKWSIPIAAGDKRAKIIALAAVALGIVVAVKISPMVLPASLVIIISAIMRVCEQRLSLKIEMLWFFDAGVALAILSLLIK